MKALSIVSIAAVGLLLGGCIPSAIAEMDAEAEVMVMPSDDEETAQIFPAGQAYYHLYCLESRDEVKSYVKENKAFGEVFAAFFGTDEEVAEKLKSKGVNVDNLDEGQPKGVKKVISDFFQGKASRDEERAMLSRFALARSTTGQKMTRASLTGMCEEINSKLASQLEESFNKMQLRLLDSVRWDDDDDESGDADEVIKRVKFDTVQCATIGRIRELQEICHRMQTEPWVLEKLGL